MTVKANRLGAVRSWLAAARVHHWVKNVLVFVPAAAAQALSDPVVLANAGVLDGKKATGHTAQGADKILMEKGCEYTGESVTVDGNIITGFGPSSADSFAVAIIQALK